MAALKTKKTKKPTPASDSQSETVAPSHPKSVDRAAAPTQAAPARISAKQAAAQAIEESVHLYGDMVYDLCEAILWSPANAQLAFRGILRQIRNHPTHETYHTHERAWILRISCEELLAFAIRHGRKLSSAEQIELDSSANIEKRLTHFDKFFHRLHLEDQILLLLKDKYGLPYGEIATALNQPEGSLKVRRQQSLRALEEWIWEHT